MMKSPLERSLRLPDFLIVGAMRSGTSSLSRYLAEHPAVYVAPRKELHFFDEPDHFQLGVEWYASHFSAAPRGALLGEATQTYMYLPNALERIKQTLPGCRAIALLRDPVDRAYSHYWHNVERGYEPLSFEEAIEAEPQRLDGADLETRLDFSYLDRGRYLVQLERLQRVFGTENLAVLLFEELAQDPHEQFSKVCSFLAVDDRLVPAKVGRRINAYRQIRSRRLRRWAKPLPRRLKNAIGRLNSKPSEYPPLDPEIRLRVANQYRDDFEGLQHWPDFHLDLSLWPSFEDGA
jgi:Sulfotransferase domain